MPDTKKNNQKENAPQDNSFGEKVVAHAREKYVGKYTYQLGASGEGSTLDCGLFTQLCYKEAVNVELGSRCADAQMINLRNSGGILFEDQSAVIAGDLVFYKHTYNCSTDEDCGVTHVGICVNTEMQIDCGSSCGVSEREYLSYEKFFGRLNANAIALGSNVKTISGTPGGAGTKSSDKGFRIIPVGSNMVRIIKLPEKKCYAEPIYPDYVTISDTVPKWVLDATTGYENQQLAEAQGEKISNGDAPEKAPNGTNYQENDIKYLIEHNGITREEAIKILEKDDKYTRKIKWNTDGTYNIDQTDKKESNNGGEKTNA